jgi:hypothetical protein
MKLKVKDGKWGYALIPLPIIALLGYVYVLLEPLQSKYANNLQESPSSFWLIVASFLLAAFASVTSGLSQSLLSVLKEAAPETEVDTTFNWKVGGKALASWFFVWFLAFIAISFAWKGQL